MALALGLTLTSCDDDKEMFQISDLPTQSTMATDKNTVVISNDNLGQTVCTLTYSASDTEIKSTDGTSFGAGAYWLQYSLDPTFATSESKSVVPNPGNNTFSITGLDLNSMAVKLGAQYDVATRTDCVGKRALVMGKLYRRNGEWKFAALGDAFEDRSIVYTILRVMKDYSK